MKIRQMAVATLAIAATTFAFGTAQAQGFKPVLGLSVTGGGETLATVTYTDGSTQKIRSGGLVHLFGGVEYESATFAVQANVGYHVDDSNARNGSVKFSRVPVELIGFWRTTEQVRLGLGLRKATGAKLSSSGAAANVGGGSLDSKPGVIVQGEYAFSPTVGLLLRFVAEDYEVGNAKIGGNHGAVGVAFRF
jgi:hypothetical protein